MRNIFKTGVSAVLAAVTVFTMVLSSACAVGASSTAAEDPKNIERVVVDCRSAEAFGKTSKVYVHTPTASEPDPFTGGKYSFNSIMNAMEVEYNPNQTAANRYRVLTMFNQKGNLTEEYKYFVIVYAAMTETPYKLTLWNGLRAGPELVINGNGKDTKAKFVVSDAFDISGANDKGISTLSRWMSTIHATISFNCSDPNSRFFIKEYAFFKSPEDAKAYYAGVDLDKDPMEYGENAVKVGSAAPSTTVKPVDPDNNVCEVNYAVAEEPKIEVTEDYDKDLEPVIMDFTNTTALAKNAMIRDFSGDPSLTGIGGIQEFVTVDGVEAMQLKPSAYPGFYNYRVMPFFTSSSRLTRYHKYVCVTFMTDDYIPHSIYLKNNAGSDNVALTTNTAVSRGKFVTTVPKDISGGILTRFLTPTHNTLQVDSILEGTNIYIKELAFFATEKAAYDYYGDQIITESEVVDYDVITFGKNGILEAARDEVTWGNSTDTDEYLEINYAQSTNFPNIKYMAKIRPTSKGSTNRSYRYLRVLYSADNPDDVKKASMFWQCDMHGAKECVRVTDNVVDTNGKFVLSDTVYIFDHQAERIYNGVFNTLYFNTLSDGGSYKIKAIYLFPDRASAEAFNVSDGTTELTVAGNDISKYQIVVSKDAPVNVVSAAESTQNAIETLSGVKIPVVTDEAPFSDYEILIGQSSRPLSTERIAELKELSDLHYAIYVKDNNVVITSVLGITAPEAVQVANKSLFCEGVVTLPDKVDIPSTMSAVAIGSYTYADFWETGDPVEDPEVVTVSFDTDEGYFNEDDGESNWRYENGKYVTDAQGYASSYLHVYEKNVTYKATLTYTAENDGVMGILTRVNSYKAYIKTGYDFKEGEWYIESRDGKDYYLNRAASAKADIVPGTAYELVLTLLGDKATLTVNGEAVITDAIVDHVSPGRVGVYAENASVSVDNIEITLVSGQGTVWKNVYHTRIPGEFYLEGGTVTEMKDGSLIYTHQSGTTYKSLDDGKSWQKTDKWLDDTFSYLNLIRLPNGDLLHIVTRNVDGKNYKASRTSSDEGKTWVDGGIICDGKYKVTSTAGAGNMNDKIMLTKDGRILYCQAYESTKESGLVDGRYIFCRYYFSDDNGMTWYKSETDSWEIEGIENEIYFGENKLLECADGTIRMYASWHMLGCVVYSESTDGGKTFGPIQYLYNMPTPTSSMQFVKDEYADNDYTYYMVWLNAEIQTTNTHTPRSRLSLAKTTDGKNWVYLGDVMRWESTYMSGTTIINHVVDPFIKTTEDYIICGTGFAEGTKEYGEGGPSAHQGQRQNIFTIRKDTLPVGIPIN